MVVTSPKLSGLVIAAIPLIVLPLVAFGRSVRRKSRLAQDTLADATAYASEQIGAVRTLQAFTNERLVTGRFSRAVEAVVRGGEIVGARARHPDLRRHLRDLRLGRGGAVVRLARRAVGRHDAGHAQPVPDLCGDRGRRARRAVGGLGRSQPGGRRFRAHRRAAGGKAGHRGAAGTRRPAADADRLGRIRRCRLRLSGASRPAVAARPQLRDPARRDGGDRRTLRRRKEHALLADPALLRSAAWKHLGRRRRSARGRSRQRCAPASPSCRRT